MHLQRNATQRIPQLYLNNNFKFYIFQFFRAFNFLSVFIRLAKISSLIKNSFGKNSLSLRVKRSNLNLVKFDFYNLISLINKFYTKWIATPSLRSARNDNFNYAFPCALKNQFEIISRNENYAFDYNKYFCRNGNNQSLSLRGFAKNRSNLFSGLLHFVRNDGDGLFSRNDYGRKFIFGFGNNLNFGFLFNRKTKKNKFMSAF